MNWTNFCEDCHWYTPPMRTMYGEFRCVGSRTKGKCRKRNKEVQVCDFCSDFAYPKWIPCHDCKHAIDIGRGGTKCELRKTRVSRRHRCLMAEKKENEE